MRPSLLIPSLLALLVAVRANTGDASEVPVLRRFAGRGTLSSAENLTEAQIYARLLTHQQPTRRSTAQRRQVSEVPASDNTISVAATNANTGSSLGALTLTSTGLNLDSTDTGVVLNTKSSPSWASRTERRITIPSLAGYPYLGVVQFSITGGLTLGAGLSNGLLVTGLSSPTPAGDLPASVPSYGNSGPPLAGETDVWTIDYTTGRISVQWVNPDGSTPSTILISNGVDLAATGDLEAFNIAFGPGWFVTSLTYSDFIV